MITSDGHKFPELSKYIALLLEQLYETKLFSDIYHANGTYTHIYLDTNARKYSEVLLVLGTQLSPYAESISAVSRPMTSFRGENIVNVELSRILVPFFEKYNIAPVALYRTGLSNFFRYPDETSVYRVAVRFVTDHMAYEPVNSELERIMVLKTINDEHAEIPSFNFYIDDTKQFIRDLRS